MFARCFRYVALAVALLAFPARAALPYSQDFQSTSVGSLPSGWVGKIGTWAVTATNPTGPGTHALASTATDGNAILYTGDSAIADQDIRYDTYVGAANGAMASIVLRSDSSYANAYVITPSGGGYTSWDFYKRVASVYVSLGTKVAYTGATASGTSLSIRARIKGNVIYLKVWGFGQTEPYNWSTTLTDGTITAAGYPGFYNAYGSGAVSNANNFIFSDPTTPAQTTIAVDNASLFWSPSGWDTLAINTFGAGNPSIKSMQTGNAGNYVKWSVTGTGNVTANLDPQMYSGGGSGLVMRFTIDNGLPTDVTLGTAQTTQLLSDSLDATKVHAVEVYLKNSNGGSPNQRWGSAGVSPNYAMRITGFSVDTGATLSTTSSLRTKRAVVFGDSITEGYQDLGAASSDGTQTYAAFMAQALNAEYGQIGWGSQGWEVVGSGGVPKFITAYPFYSSGRSRSWSNLDYVVSNHGTNDVLAGTADATVQSDCQTWIAGVRALVATTTWIIVTAPMGGQKAAPLSACVTAYRLATPSDTRVVYTDISARLPTAPFAGFSNQNQMTIDGLHPNVYAGAFAGPTYASQIISSTTSGSGTKVFCPVSPGVNGC